MTAAWLTVATVGLATMAIKAAGPVLLGGRPLPQRLTGVVALLAPALLAALVATLTFGSAGSLILDSRVVGVGAGALAIALRVPTLLVVLIAGAATALARAAGMS